MMNLECEYLNTRFEITVDAETHAALMQDEEQRNNYIKRVYETSINPYTQSEEMESQPLEGKPHQWKKETIVLLIETRLSRELEFNRPTCKKKKLWQQIAKIINEKLRVNVTSDECDLKYRNLLKTYKNNKKKQQSSGESAITWEFFERFDHVLGCKAAITPAEGSLYDTLENDDSENIEPDSQPYEELPASPSASAGSAGTDVNTQKSKKRKMQISDYLLKKLEMEDEKNKRKELFQQQKWEEEKLLKEKEINAILKLVQVLASKCET
ncbi:uncharacterized protein LOC116164723 [Photinus pyralis]|uniref:uncharacterized protein LOC116164723 n=2 Tax=Photinus pyralis TaxID=7054 RepID=UPI00126728D6|nr:uncharacterized protein LOC116164723 [Photinus pyralis]